MNQVLMLAAWGQENRNLLLAAGLIILTTLIAMSELRRMQRKLGIMPQYLAWLEAKTDLYEATLRIYANPEFYEEHAADGLPIAKTDGGEIAARALHSFAGQQPAPSYGETTWLPQSQDTARTSATAGRSM